MSKIVYLDSLNAYALMKAISTLLDLNVSILPEYGEGKYFSFDSDTGEVLCSTISIGEIYRREINNPKCCHSTQLIIEKARHQISGLNCVISDAAVYAMFSCLHEIGHYVHWKETDEEQFRMEEVAHCEELQRLTSRAQNDADGGMSHEEVYKRFAIGYRLISLEKNADDYATKTICHVIRAWGE